MTGTTKIKTKEVIDCFLETIMSTLEEGGNVQLSNFGVFTLVRRASRVGRNPHTGEAVPIPARMVPAFTPSDSMKNRTSIEIYEKKVVN